MSSKVDLIIPVSSHLKHTLTKPPLLQIQQNIINILNSPQHPPLRMQILFPHHPQLAHLLRMNRFLTFNNALDCPLP